MGTKGFAMNTKPDWIEAAVRELQDKYSLTGEFHDLETKAAKRIRAAMMEIIRKHAATTSYYAKCFEAASEGLNHPWPPPTHSTVAHETGLSFIGIQLILRPDGTYCLSDTSGG